MISGLMLFLGFGGVLALALGLAFYAVRQHDKGKKGW